MKKEYYDLSYIRVFSFSEFRLGLFNDLDILDN